MNWKHLPLGLLLMITACGPAKKALKEKPTELEPVTISANNNPMDILRESAPRIWDITNARVALSFNYKEKTANGRAWLDMKPYNNPIDSIVLDAKDMKIDSVVLISNGATIPVTFNYRDNQVVVSSNRLRSLNNSFQLYLKYLAMPYADSNAKGSRAISEARGLYFINTDHSIPNKPVQIWTQGETESNSHWMPTNDKPNERFTTQIELTVPDSFKTLSNGYKVSGKPAGKGFRTDIWKMDMPIQAYAVMFAIGDYAIVTDKWRGKEVSYYVEPEYEPYARKMFNHTTDMMDFFSDFTGVPYPWNKYNQVVARDYVSGAMENTTASLFGESVNQNDREIEDRGSEDIVSHELFHQWFGDYVTMESWTHLTVSESFANYGEQLWRKHCYGQNSADELAFNDLNGYLFGMRQNDPMLVRYYYRDKEEMFDRISYNKGGATLRYLHGLMGDTLFSKAMKLYLTKNALQSTEASHWRLAVEEATGRDWNWFFNEWYFKAGHPELDVKYKYNDSAGKLTVTVKQRTPSDSLFRYQLPLKAAVIRGNSMVIEDWKIVKKTEIFTYEYKNGQRPVIVPDYYAWLPGIIKEDKKAAQYLTQMNVADNYFSRKRALTFANDNFDEPESKAIFKVALEDTAVAIKVNALNLLSNKSLQESFKEQVVFLALQDRSNKVRAAAFACLGEWKVGSIQKEMLEAVNSRSYVVAGKALDALYRVDEQTAYDKARKMITTDPKSTLETTVWKIISKQGKNGDLAFFEEQKDLVYGFDRTVLAKNLSIYLVNVKDTIVFDKGLGLLKELYDAVPGQKGSIFSFIITGLGPIGEKKNDPGNAAKYPKVKALLQSWVDDMKQKEAMQKLLDHYFK